MLTNTILPIIKRMYKKLAGNDDDVKDFITVAPVLDKMVDHITQGSGDNKKPLPLEPSESYDASGFPDGDYMIDCGENNFVLLFLHDDEEEFDYDCTCISGDTFKKKTIMAGTDNQIILYYFQGVQPALPTIVWQEQSGFTVHQTSSTDDAEKIVADYLDSTGIEKSVSSILQRLDFATDIHNRKVSGNISNLSTGLYYNVDQPAEMVTVSIGAQTSSRPSATVPSGSLFLIYSPNAALPSKHALIFTNSKIIHLTSTSVEEFVTNAQFDSEMSDDSTNAVQNKVIKAYVDEQIASAIANVSSLIGEVPE